MATCDTCSLAQWRKSTNGRLHPNGSGRCNWKYKPPVIAASHMWLSGRPAEPAVLSINRHELPNHCPTYQPKKAEPKP